MNGAAFHNCAFESGVIGTGPGLGYRRRNVGIVISREIASCSTPRTWRSRSWRKK
jgi:hypothetical protein